MGSIMIFPGRLTIINGPYLFSIEFTLHDQNVIISKLVIVVFDIDCISYLISQNRIIYIYQVKDKLNKIEHS